MNCPEWIKCIRDNHEDNKGLSWCRRMVSGEWTFTDIDHAAMNGRNQGRLVACPECVKAVIAGLKEGS
jgi:hypothetical protein